MCDYSYTVLEAYLDADDRLLAEVPDDLFDLADSDVDASVAEGLQSEDLLVRGFSGLVLFQQSLKMAR